MSRLSALVRLVLAGNASPWTLEGTNTYVVGNRTPIVIDPGPEDAAHLGRVLQEAGMPSVILLTHTHPDHAEGARRFAEMSGSPIAAFAAGDGTAAVGDGQRIRAGDATLVAVRTPGHSSDHLCFWLEEERALFTGDHVLGRGTTVVAHPDGDMTDYLGSLDRVRGLGATRLYPGHGPVVEDPAPVLQYYVTHRLEREAQVLAAIDAGDRTVGEMVERIYADVDRALHGAAALSVSAHLDKLRFEGAVDEEEPGSWRRR